MNILHTFIIRLCSVQNLRYISHIIYQYSFFHFSLLLLQFFFRMMAKINRIFPYSSPSHFLLMKEFSLMASCTSWNQISSRNLQHCFPQQLERSTLIRSIITISLLLPCPTFLLFCSNWLVPPKPAVRSELVSPV